MFRARGLPFLVLLLVGFGCRPDVRDLKRPNRVVLAPDGRELYVSDFHHQRVAVFDRDGHFVRAMGVQGLGTDELWRVWDLVLEEPRTVLVINERPLSSDDDRSVWEVKRFVEGREKGVYPLHEANRNPNAWPNALVSLGRAGYLVADTGLGAILRFDPAWRYLGRWQAPSGGEPFESPSALRRVGSDLWLVEPPRHRIRRLTLDGHEAQSFGRPGSGPGELRFPRALAVCPERWLAVADMGNYRVQRFDLSGRYLDGFAPPSVSPRFPPQILDVAVSPDCSRLYVVDSKGHRVLVTDPRGTLITAIATW